MDSIREAFFSGDVGNWVLVVGVLAVVYIAHTYGFNRE